MHGLCIYVISWAHHNVILNNSMHFLVVTPLLDYSGLDPSLPRLLGYESKFVPDSPYWTQLNFQACSLPSSIIQVCCVFSSWYLCLRYQALVYKAMTLSIAESDRCIPSIVWEVGLSWLCPLWLEMWFSRSSQASRSESEPVMVSRWKTCKGTPLRIKLCLPVALFLNTLFCF